MSQHTRTKTLLITSLLLLSTLSFFTIALTENVKADSTFDKTTLYFHDRPFEEEIENDDILMLIEDIMYMKLMEQMENLDFDNMTTEELILQMATLESGISGDIIDINPPTKLNDSEHPPIITVETLLDAYKNNDSGFIEDLTKSFSPFKGIYVYDGDNTVDLIGDVELSLYYNRPLSYFWTSDIIDVNFTVVSLDDEGINYKINKTQQVEINRKPLGGSALKNPGIFEVSFPINIELEPLDVIFVEFQRTVGNKPVIDSLIGDIDIDIEGITDQIEEIGQNLSESKIGFIAEFGETLLNISEIAHDIEDILNETDIYSLAVELISSSFIYDSVDHQSSITLPGSITLSQNENNKVYYLHNEETNGEFNENKPAADEHKTFDLSSKEVGTWTGPDLQRSKILKKVTAGLYIDYHDLYKLPNH